MEVSSPTVGAPRGGLGTQEGPLGLVVAGSNPTAWNHSTQGQCMFLGPVCVRDWPQVMQHAVGAVSRTYTRSHTGGEWNRLTQASVALSWVESDTHPCLSLDDV